MQRNFHDRRTHTRNRIAETESPKPNRRNRIAEEKAALRIQLAALVNKVPNAVNAGGVQTTREWLDANKGAMSCATRKRASRHQLKAALDVMSEWRQRADPAA